ncbi:addiction module protein [Lentilactobacillus fungorum]|uniref:Endoribonuclease YoeB n=1 Tax=Lentilactobacillus fungorum TaxID=2201250 RepID=A0ABQ3W0A4_9LACO|nr:Txe/YoeB family addiction module toxin [Lentilactobacillus fungorum]GHP14136.1 addiction module protein [Lentilactobacillus fungorum]
MSYRIKINSSAKADLKKINRSHLKDSFLEIISALKSDPYQPTQSFEKLQPYHNGFYSRRINEQHRVIYKVDGVNHVVKIFAAWTHYDAH